MHTKDSCDYVLEEIKFRHKISCTCIECSAVSAARSLATDYKKQLEKIELLERDNNATR